MIDSISKFAFITDNNTVRYASTLFKTDKKLITEQIQYSG
jgi:hypothetical protein